MNNKSHCARFCDLTAYINNPDGIDFLFSLAIINKTPIEIDMIRNIYTSIRETRDDRLIGFLRYRDIIDNIIESNDRSHIMKMINDLHNYKLSDAQKAIILRIMRHKHITYKKDEIIVKPCPHCGKELLLPVGSTYAICGRMMSMDQYTGGCGRDWCFLCGKKLCKSWDKNKLFMHSKRKHTSTCCIKYAKKNKLRTNDMCRCPSVICNHREDNI